MKKILGMIAILVLCAATAKARTATGPPDSVDCISICWAHVAIGVQVNHNETVVASNIDVSTSNPAIAGDETDSLLKGPRAYALDQLQFRGNPDAAIFMSIRAGRVAVIHSPPANPCGLMIVTS